MSHVASLRRWALCAVRCVGIAPNGEPQRRPPHTVHSAQHAALPLRVDLLDDDFCECLAMAVAAVLILLRFVGEAVDLLAPPLLEHARRDRHASTKGRPIRRALPSLTSSTRSIC